MVAPMCSPIPLCSHGTHPNHMGQKWEYHFGTFRGEGLMTIQPLPSSDAWVVGLPRPRHPQKHRRQTWPSLFRHPLSVDSPFQTFHALVGCFVCVHEDWYGYQVERGIARKYWVHTYILGRENMCIDMRMFHNDPVSSVSKSWYSWTKHMPEQVHLKPAWLQNPNVPMFVEWFREVHMLINIHGDSDPKIILCLGPWSGLTGTNYPDDPRYKGRGRNVAQTWDEYKRLKRFTVSFIVPIYQCFEFCWSPGPWLWSVCIVMHCNVL